MKKSFRICTILFTICLILCVLSACSKNTDNPFVGKWNGYKISAGSDEIVFSDYAALVKLELIAEFSANGTYVFHYYVDGEEGDNYPQKGKYEISDNKIILDDSDAYGKIIANELVLYFDNGEVQQYFTLK